MEQEGLVSPATEHTSCDLPLLLYVIPNCLLKLDVHPTAILEEPFIDVEPLVDEDVVEVYVFQGDGAPRARYIVHGQSLVPSNKLARGLPHMHDLEALIYPVTFLHSSLCG